MNKKAVIVGLVLLFVGVAAFAATRQTEDAAPAEEGGAEGGGWVPQFDSGAAGWIDSFESWAQQNIQETQENTVTLPQLPYLQTQIAAALSAIKASEGTAGRGDPYRVCYGYVHTIVSFADHPKLTKEWAGEPLSDTMCANAGLGPGCVSTAAGAYQIIAPTWVKLKAKLGLPDFSPESQDAAATELMRQRGAFPYLERGDFAGAIAACKKEWASLPGAGYGQGERSIAWLTEKFTSAGGVLA